MTLTLTITERDVSKALDASGAYQDIGPSVELKMKNDATRTQAINLAKSIKRLTVSKLKVVLEDSEEITTIK